MYKKKFLFSAVVTAVFAILFYTRYRPVFDIANTQLWLYAFCTSLMFAAILFVVTYHETIRFPIYISAAIALLSAIITILLSI